MVSILDTEQHVAHTIPAFTCDDSELLRKANKDISDLKEDIRRFSDELQTKDSLLSIFSTRLPVLTSFEVAEHSKKQPNSTLQDTFTWDPSACHRPSCSTPNHGSSRTEVVTRGHRTGSDGSVSTPCVSLSNRYTALADSNPVHPANPTAPPPLIDQYPSAVSTGPAAPSQPAAEGAGAMRVARDPTREPIHRPSSRTLISSARRRILKEAVLQRSLYSLPHVRHYLPYTPPLPRSLLLLRPPW
ncbi:putative allantoinase-like [Scophthalmus maximus]|uniref:Putative allantoinase-like n=1 Tax=Scophthalmus maximus TaxID=52904 RepID=A0A2U9CZ51_SCOMX|nr:putative allantoinase-like [Scophthalmus maximus]